MRGKKAIYTQNIFIKILRIFLLIILFPVVLIYLAVKYKQYRKIKLKEADLIEFYGKSQLGSLTGIEFEECLLNLFEKMGYKVRLTKTTGDFGADLIICKNGKTSIVQAKRYSHTVGVKAVQEVIAAREFYKIEDSFVITNSTFSAEAKQLADEAGVHLIDGEFLEKLLSKYSVKIAKNPKNTTAMSRIAIGEIRARYRYWI